VYNACGFGFNESVYMGALSLELRGLGLRVEREVPKEVFYHGQPIAKYRIDMLVDRRLMVECKASKCLTEVDHQQLLNYLKGVVSATIRGLRG
jgi:GxxExxY protein